MQRLLLLSAFLLAGCVVPAKIYFRNLSTEQVRLRGTLVDRRRFKKLPNNVNLFDTAAKSSTICGRWRREDFVTWTDTTTFYLDVPAFTVIDLKDISNGLILGTHEPNVLLVVIRKNRTDTVTTGDLASVEQKFKRRPYNTFTDPIYYFDIH
jgi:hypothetical protein